MSKGDEFEVVCGPMVAGGSSLVRRTGEKTVFVDGGIPGETVRVVVTNERKDLINAEVVEVLEASPLRVEPSVQLPAEAGGCEWQHISVEGQQQFKIEIVKDALARIAKKPDFEVSFAGGVDPTGYRTTMRFALVDGRVAMRKHASHDLVVLEKSEVAHPLLQELLSANYGDASEVTLRVSDSTGERFAWVKDDDFDDIDLPQDVVITNDGRHVATTEEVGGRKWQVSAKSFFQSGRQAAQLLSDIVDKEVPADAGWIVDTYAGVGILGGVSAEERDAKLTAVEQSRSAVRDARNNLADLAAEVIEAETSEVELPGSTNPDVVIADPSRTGLGPSATKAIVALGADTIVLVSCDPASLARDVNLLTAANYSLDKVQVVDVFPHTAHVETVSTFSLLA